MPNKKSSENLESASSNLLSVRHMRRSMRLHASSDPKEVARTLDQILKEAIAVQAADQSKLGRSAINELRQVRQDLLAGQIKAGKRQQDFVSKYSLVLDEIGKAQAEADKKVRGDNTKEVSDNLKQSLKGILPSSDTIISGIITANPAIGYSVKLLSRMSGAIKEQRKQRAELYKQNILDIQKKHHLNDEEEKNNDEKKAVVEKQADVVQKQEKVVKTENKPVRQRSSFSRVSAEELRKQTVILLKVDKELESIRTKLVGASTLNDLDDPVVQAVQDISSETKESLQKVSSDFWNAARSTSKVSKVMSDQVVSQTNILEKVGTSTDEQKSALEKVSQAVAAQTDTSTKLLEQTTKQTEIQQDQLDQAERDRNAAGRSQRLTDIKTIGKPGAMTPNVAKETEAGGGMLSKLMNFAGLKSLIGGAGGGLLGSIIGFFTGGIMGKILGGFGKFFKLFASLSGILRLVGKFAVVGAVITGIFDFVDGLFNAEKLFGHGDLNILDRISAGFANLIAGFVTSITGIIDWVSEKLFGTSIFGFDQDGLAKMILDFRQNVIDALSNAIETVVNFFKDTGKFIAEGIPEWTDKVLLNMKNMVLGVFSSIGDAIGGFIDSVTPSFMKKNRGSTSNKPDSALIAKVNTIPTDIVDAVSRTAVASSVDQIPISISGQNSPVTVVPQPNGQTVNSGIVSQADQSNTVMAAKAAIGGGSNTAVVAPTTNNNNVTNMSYQGSMSARNVEPIHKVFNTYNQFAFGIP